MSFTVDDIEQTARHPARVGITLASPRGEARGIDRNRGMWIADPDGNRIEIMEMAPDCIQREAVVAMKAGKGRQSLLVPRHPKRVEA